MFDDIHTFFMYVSTQMCLCPTGSNIINRSNFFTARGLLRNLSHIAHFLRERIFENLSYVKLLWAKLDCYPSNLFEIGKHNSMTAYRYTIDANIFICDGHDIRNIEQ